MSAEKRLIIAIAGIIIILSLFSDRHVVSGYLNFGTCIMKVTLYVPRVDEFFPAWKSTEGNND